MAILLDPDQLSNGTEVVFNTTNKTIQLIQAGNLSADGVTLQALYSFCKDQWGISSELIKFPFPMEAITTEKFDFINGWKYADTTTVNLFRNGGFSVKNPDGSSAEEWAGIITLGTIGIGNQAYFQQELDGPPINFVYTEAVNECIKVYGDSNNGNFDYRQYLKLFIREYGSVYGTASINDIGVVDITYQAYRFPLTNRPDIKITYSTTVADTYGVTITYYDTPVQREIEGINYNFDIVINGNGLGTERIYEAVQSLLQKNINIDSGIGTVNGKTADELLTFVGSNLITSTGVYIDNFDLTFINNILFFDTSGEQRAFPFVAQGVITFSDTLVNDVSSEYRMLYQTDFGTAACLTVLDSNDVEITGPINTNTVTFTFDYDGNGGFDQYVTIVANGLETGQYIKVDGLITRSINNNFVVSSASELNFTFPENQ